MITRLPAHSAAPDWRPVVVNGIPLAPFTFEDTVTHVEQLIEAGEPGYFVTANANYAMLHAQRSDIRAVTRDAAFLIADGMPLVWAARLQSTPLPGRVAGADLLPALCELAAQRKYRTFFLGGAPGEAEAAIEKLQTQVGPFRVGGIAAPNMSELSAEDHAQLMEQIRRADPHLLLVSLGQPKGDLWIHRHYRHLGRAVCVQVGGAFAFAAGRVRRAPEVLQRCGLEWTYRLCCEPRRLASRYLSNAAFASQMLTRSLFQRSAALRLTGQLTSDGAKTVS